MEHLRPLLYSRFIFINEDTPERLFLGSRKHKAIIPNGVDPELLALPTLKGNYILYLGRIDMYAKGLDLLIFAYSEFYKYFPDVKLVVAGDGRDMPELKSAIKKLPADVRENIKLLGWVSGEDKPGFRLTREPVRY